MKEGLQLCIWNIWRGNFSFSLIFVYWLSWVFVAAWAFSLVAASGGLLSSCGKWGLLIVVACGDARHTHPHMHMHTHKHTHTYSHMHTHKHTYTHMHTHIHTHTGTHTHAHSQIHIHTLTHTLTHTLIHTHHAHTHPTLSCTHTYTHMHTHINNKCWRGCGGKGTFPRCWWECKLVQKPV